MSNVKIIEKEERQKKEGVKEKVGKRVKERKRL